MTAKVYLVEVYQSYYDARFPHSAHDTLEGAKAHVQSLEGDNEVHWPLGWSYPRGDYILHYCVSKRPGDYAICEMPLHTTSKEPTR